MRKKERTPKERVIFDNYDSAALEKMAREELSGLGNASPSDEEIWEEAAEQERIWWEQEEEGLESVFSGDGRFIAIGTCGTWRGNFRGGFVFGTYAELARKLFKDCGYFRFWDEDGRFFIRCSHHDGTHEVEVKQLTDRGLAYLENWEYGTDGRTEEYIHGKLFNDPHYSKRLNYAHRMWGCPVRQAA